MQDYPTDSPQAMAQLLTALMAADDRIDDAEVEALSILDAYARIGIAPPAFADVLRDYFASAEPGAPTETAERVAVRITDGRARLALWEMMVALARADDQVCPAETAFLQRIAGVWWDGVVPPRLPVPGAGGRPAGMLPPSARQSRGGIRPQAAAAG